MKTCTSLVILLCCASTLLAQQGGRQKDNMNMSMPMPKTAKADTLPSQKPVSHKGRAMQMPMPDSSATTDTILMQMPTNDKGHQMKSMQPKRTTQNEKGKIVEYYLYVSDTTVNFTGEKANALCINGQIPAPTLFFNEGDTAVVIVHNLLNTETSIHWHGILLPNDQDGVPYLNTAPIEPKGMHTFTFPLIQSGTYWYHSHTMLQEQSGLYGSIVIYPKQYEQSKEYVLVLSDWTDSNPHEVLRSLKRATDWYAIKKGAVQSFGEAIQAGYLKDKLKQEWMRMPPMDVSDVYYDKFLMNGKVENHFKDVQPNETIRLRIINGSTSTYFWVQYAGGSMKVVAADGLDIEPVMVDKILIAVAETYDVEIILPDDGMSYEFRATAQDISGFASAYIGTGMEMKAPDLPRLDYFAMMHEMNQMMNMSHDGMEMKNGNMKEMKPGGEKDTMKMDHPMNMEMKRDSMQGMEHGTMDMGSLKDTVQQSDSAMNMNDMATMSMSSSEGGVLDYGMLKSTKPTTLNTENPVREIHLTLTGNMLRYIWSFDNKTLSEADKILIKKGENVRFVLTNNTMMQHPLHLHGHFFRLINRQGNFAPLKHTFDIPPMETVTIEFYANEEKDWFFHCHILYHMMAGMARIISYEETSPEPIASEKYRPLLSEDETIYSYGSATVHSQGTWGYFSFSNNNYLFDAIGRVSWRGNYETETHLARYLDAQQFLSVYVGSDVRKNKSIGSGKNTKDNRQAFEAGVLYLLPFFVQSELRIDNTARVRFQVSRSDMPFTSRLRFDWLVNSDKEYSLGLRYILTKHISLSANYDSDYKSGGGLTFTY